jgi:hypothetical protein
MAMDPLSSLATNPALTPTPAVAGVAAVVGRAPTAGVASASAAPLASGGTAAAASPALQAAVSHAAATQGGLAGLLADLTAALGSTTLPNDVEAAAAQILDAQLALDPPPSAQDLQQAVAQSGLFLEAQLADAGAPAAGDLKAALLTLAQTLEPLTDAEAPGSSGGAGPPPPYAGAALQGQPPATAILPPDAALEMIAALLSKETKGALSRQMLMQAASLPKSGRTSAEGADARPSANWLFELLFAAPDGPAVAQFQIDREGEPPHDGAPDPIWRVRFSLDFAPIGPIHARISLSAGKAHVALWAENDVTRTQLEAQQGDLTDALREDDLVPEVAVFQGRPNAPPAPVGQFMNRAI